MSKLRSVLNWWHGLAALVAAFAFATPLLAAVTDEDPAGEAGLHAALIALCAAAMFTVETINADKWQVRKLPSLCIGVSLLASAYLWIAEEASIHPADPDLIAGISIVWAMVLVVFIIPLVVLATKKNNASVQE